jgi:uncharacterized delta-60 repeat protein
MAIFKNTPPMVTNGMVLCLDSANQQSVPVLPTINYAVPSENIGIWNLQNGSVINNVTTAPDGTLTADLYIPNTTSSQHRGFIAVNIPGPRAFSIYAKPAGYNFLSLGMSGGVAGGNIVFDLLNGTISGSDVNFVPYIEQVGNGWYRCGIQDTAISSTSLLSYLFVARNNTVVQDYAGDGTSGIYVWGSQLELGTNITPYVKALSSVGIRNNWFNLTNKQPLSLSGWTNTVINGGRSFNFNNNNGFAQLPSLVSLPNWSVSRVYQNNFQANGEIVGSKIASRILSTPTDGNVILHNLGVFATLFSITIDPLNNLYVGSFGTYKYRDVTSFLVTKINSGGAIDNSFNLTDFNTLADAGAAVSVSNIILNSGGTVGYLGSNANLTNQTRFNTTTGERTILSIPNHSGPIGGKSLILDEVNNHIYVGLFGESIISGVSYRRMARLNATTLVADPTFNTTNGFNDQVTAACLDVINNKIYCIGSFTSYKGQTYNRIIRLNLDGSIDDTFNIGNGITGSNTTMNSIFLDANNKPIIAGGFGTYNGTSQLRIIRLNLDGSVDTTFNTGTGFNSIVSDMKYDSVNQKIYCVGSFTSYNESSRNYIIRLNLDGSIDNTFNIGTGFNSFSDTIGLQNDGKVVVGCSGINVFRTFTHTYNGNQFASLIRLNYDGSIDNTFNAGLGFTEAIYRNQIFIRYFTSGGASQTLQDVNYYPLSGRVPISQFQNYYNNKFHYLVITKGDDNIYRIYEDGILRETLTVPDGSDTRLDFQRISGMDEVPVTQIYNRALSQQEVIQNYNSMKQRFNIS